MQWRKLGKIFNTTKFAQSPQVLDCGDYLRVYYSTRTADGNKYLSHVAFVDLDNKYQIINSSKTVIPLGKLGCFDEHGIFPFNVLRSDKIYGFIGGWSRRASVSIDTAIGLAISENNGLSFTRIGDGPILGSSLHEPFLVGDPFVISHNNEYHMWYIYGTQWINSQSDTELQRIYKIGYAHSKDLINWEKKNKQIIKDKLNENECQALPSVIKYDGIFHMFFCYRQAIGFRINKECSYRIGYAWSKDLSTWIRDDDNVGITVSDSGWDSEMMCYPHVFKRHNKIYMLYNGNEFGRYGFGLASLE